MIVGCVAIAYGAFDMLMISRENAVRDVAPVARSGVDEQTFAARAALFNTLVNKAVHAARSAPARADIMRALFTASGGSVIVNEASFNEASRSIVLRGTAGNEQEIIAFKGALSRIPALSRIDLPLSSIVPVSGGRSSFTATVTLK